MESIKKPSVLILGALGLFIALFVAFLYTFLHEAGHALAGLFFGQSLTEFDISFWDFSAHVGIAGGELTQSQLAIRSAAGAILPLLTWLVFMVIVPRHTSFSMGALKLIGSMVVVNTVLPWIILPVWFLLGTAPPDDVTHFLRYSQIHPLLLTFTALMIYIGGWALFLSKINGLRNEFLSFRNVDRETLLAGTGKLIPAIAGVMAFGVMLTFMLNRSAATNLPGRLSPPPNFESVAQIDLSTRPYSAEILAQFTLEKPAYLGVFITVRGIDTTYFDLSVIGPEGFRSTVLHGEGYHPYQDGGLWEENLAPGNYQIVLTSHQSQGTASVYLKID